MYNIKHYKFNNRTVSLEEVNKEIAEYENLAKNLRQLETHIENLQKNIKSISNSQSILKKYYEEFKRIENKLFEDIYDVALGKKALGYLPEKHFKPIGRNTNYFVLFAIDNNLDFYVSNKYGQETVAVYNRDMLELILKANEEILINSGLSLDVDEFVDFVMDKPSVYYEDNPKLFILIALAFNDPRLEVIL